jgi:hypothetical protein
MPVSEIIIFAKNVIVLTNSTGSINTSSWGTDFEIVFNHKCRVISGYPSILTDNQIWKKN